MKQLTKISLLFLLLSSSIFFLPIRLKSNEARQPDHNATQQAVHTETGAMELHRNAGLASLQ